MAHWKEGLLSSPGAAVLRRRLVEENGLDLALFRWAAELVRERIRTAVTDARPAQRAAPEDWREVMMDHQLDPDRLPRLPRWE